MKVQTPRSRNRNEVYSSNRSVLVHLRRETFKRGVFSRREIDVGLAASRFSRTEHRAFSVHVKTWSTRVSSQLMFCLFMWRASVCACARAPGPVYNLHVAMYSKKKPAVIVSSRHHSVYWICRLLLGSGSGGGGVTFSGPRPRASTPNLRPETSRWRQVEWPLMVWRHTESHTDRRCSWSVGALQGVCVCVCVGGRGGVRCICLQTEVLVGLLSFLRFVR